MCFNSLPPVSLTVSQKTLSRCNIACFLSSPSLANDLRMRKTAACIGGRLRATERSRVGILSHKYDLPFQLGGAS